MIDSIGAEIIDLREEHQDLMTTAAKHQELQERLEDLDNFLDEQTEAITEYSEALVRRLIEKITVDMGWQKSCHIHSYYFFRYIYNIFLVVPWIPGNM